MNKLESLAKDLFTHYSLKETGITPNWAYLNNDRKIDWMEEVLITSDTILDSINKQVVINDMGQQSNIYSMGYNEAVKVERLQFKELVARVNRELHEELEQFKLRILEKE